MSMFSTTLAILATLLAPFALIVGAVVSLMRRTEDDEFADAINRNMNARTVPLGEWLVQLRDACDPRPDEVPTAAVLARWDEAQA